MTLNKVKELKRAVCVLSPDQLEESCAWFDEYQHPLDIRIKMDLAADRLNKAIAQALSDKQSGGD